MDSEKKEQVINDEQRHNFHHQIQQNIENLNLNKQIDIEQPQISRFAPTQVMQLNLGISPKLIKTETGIKQNEIIFTEQSFPHNIKSSIEEGNNSAIKNRIDTIQDRIISIKCLKIQRMEYFLQQLQLQLLREKLKKDFLNEAVFFLEISVFSPTHQEQQTYRLRRVYLDFKNLDKNLIKEILLKNILVKLPEFPFVKDPKNLFDKEVFQKLGQYLVHLTQKSAIFLTNTFQQFFEISTNFYSGVVKVKETFIKKRSGGRFKKKCFAICHSWQVRYLAITSEGLMYSRGNNGEMSKIREILMFDQNFNMEYGKVQTGKEQGIKITTSTRRIFLECYSQFHFYDVLAAFKEAISLSPYIEIHRFDSFAPERKDAECKWFIDGNDYFKDLYTNLIKAKSSVYITDWWLSPENYLLRPVGEFIFGLASSKCYYLIITRVETWIEYSVNQIFCEQLNPNSWICLKNQKICILKTLKFLINNIQYDNFGFNFIIIFKKENQESRLDRLLQSIAEKGVLIMIILYKEPTIALTLDSNYTKQYLKSLHPNIVIMRHPDTLLPFLWSHHEKMVVIDQQIGYIGGLDLCYGRYDTKEHNLSDLPFEQNGENCVHFPGIDYSNARTKDFDNVKNHSVSNIDRYKQIRMPWHDVHMKVIGEPVKDMVRHFIQYWNFSKVDIYAKNNQNKIKQLIPEKPQQDEKQGISAPLKKMKTKIKGAFDKIKKKVKNKIQRYDSKDKFNNQQLQNESMKGKFLDNKSRFNLFLSELKKNPTPQSPNSNSDQVSVQMNNIPQDNVLEDQNQNSKSNNNINNSNNIEGLGKLKFSKFNNNMGIESIVNSPSNKNKKNPKIEQEIVLEDGDQYEKKIQQIKRTQTNIAFICDHFSENESENNRSRQKSLNENNNKFSNFRKANKQSSLDGPILDIESVERMDDTEEFHKGEFINPIDRYTNKLPHYSILKQDSLERQNNQDPIKKESKTLKKLFGGKPKIKNTHNNPLKAIANGINLLEKINFSINEEEINFFEFSHEEQKEGNKLQVSEILDSIGPLPGNNEVNRRHSIWKSKLHDNKKDQLSSIYSTLNDQEKIEKSKININFINYKTASGTCKCQMLRSGSSWSLGLKPTNTEMSIQIAYIQLISQAKHFIYIENQFFISNTAGNVVKNQIAQALIERIISADKKGEDFFVCVVMPLLPGFSGEVNDSNAAVMKCQLHWEYFTISRGGNSIYEVLKQSVSDPFKYIRFFGLRNHGMLNNQAFSEIIYVHSKLMIVDDRFVIIGSANINDRSMCGTRDSEIAMIIEDTKKIPSRMNNKSVVTSEFGHTFRKTLYEEHFGLDETQSIDPLDPQIMKLIDERAKKNTDIYREVFRCYPDDQVVNISQLENWQKERKIDNYDILKNKIKGHAVELPLDFLKNEKLNFSIRQKEYYVPVQSFLQATWKVILNSFRFFIC